MPSRRESLRPRIWQDLTRDEGASTLVRLNVSQHVADLRLIFHATVVVMIIGVVFALLMHAWLDNSSIVSASALVAAIVGTGCGVLVWTYQSGSARLGIVDLFSCEIATICRVVTIVGAASHYAEIYRTPPSRPAVFNSAEQYTPVFDNNSKDLEVLEARTVEPVTEFYTYLKAMRDYLRLLTTIEHPDAQVEQWQAAVRGVVYMLFLTLESGRHSIQRLIEFDPERVQNIITILLSELVAYGFLTKVISPETSDHSRYNAHAARLKLREDVYLRLVPELYWETLDHRGDRDWAKASVMLSAHSRFAG